MDPEIAAVVARIREAAQRPCWSRQRRTPGEIAAVVARIRETAQPPELILSMGETRTGEEHTAEDDAQWQRLALNEVMALNLEQWRLIDADAGQLIFERK